MAGCSGSAGQSGGATAVPASAGCRRARSAGARATRPLDQPQESSADCRPVSPLPRIPSGRLITAQATGTVTGTPDVVTISLGVETRSAVRADRARREQPARHRLINVVKDKGVAPEDLQTSQLSINPSYDDKGAVTGYQVTNMVTATLRDIARAGALIDAAGQAAGDAVRVQQLSFSIDDDSALRANARADAVRRAQAQAQQLAEAAGVALGPIHSITESPTANAMVYPHAAMATDSAARSGADRGRQPGTHRLGAGGVRDRLIGCRPWSDSGERGGTHGNFERSVQRVRRTA